MATSMDVLNSVASQQSPQSQPQSQGTSMDVLKQVESDPDSAFRTAPPAPAPNSGAVGAAMANEGVTDYKPGQGLPYGHFGNSAMRSGDVTPSQARNGAIAVGTASGIGAAAEAIPAVLPHTIEGIRAIGTWAKANPASAYGLLLLLKELVPGFKKAVGIISHTPTPE